MAEHWINNKLTDMTKEEAVLKLIDVHAFLCRYSNPHDKWTDAVNIGIEAIKALEQEPTTKNDLGVDCISRAEAIKCLECDFDITGKENMKTVVNYINSVHDKIVNLPSVTLQEPKTGHWNDMPKYKDIAWQCSECEHFTTMKRNYCPNCGCRMVEPQESEDNND